MATPERLYDLELAEGIRINAFFEAVREVSFAAAGPSEERAALQGVLFSFDSGKIRLLAADAYRLASVEIDADYPTPTRNQIIVDARQLSLASRLLFAPGKSSMGDVALKDIRSTPLDKLEISSTSTGERVQISQIPAVYPDWRSLVKYPEEPAPFTTFKRTDLEEALKKFENRGVVTISRGQGKMLVRQSTADEWGNPRCKSLQTTVPAEGSPDGPSVTLRTRHLKALLKNVVSSDKFYFRVRESGAHEIVFRKVDDPKNFIYITMPFWLE